MKPTALVLPALLVLAPLLAQAAPTANLRGIVIDAASQPVPNAAIAIEHDGRSVAQARSDGLGAFFASKLPGRPVVVRATADGCAGAVAIDLTGLAEGFAPVPMYPTRTLRGRITAPGGAAVAGAWVLASPVDSEDFGSVDAIATSGVDGSYELEHVLIGPVRVRAWSATHGLFEARIDGAEAAQFDAELPGESEREVEFVLRGATTAQLAAARLRLHAQDAANMPMRLPPPLCELRPDADGRWLVHGWSADDRLVARFEVPGGAVVPPADFVPRGPRRWTSAFDVQPESALHGVLRDEQGLPIADQLLVGRAHHDDRIAGVVVAGRTGADGSFRLAAPVAPGEKFVLSLGAGEHALVHAGGRDANLLSCYLGQHEPQARHELVARRCGVVRVRVADASGQPVRGAVVSMIQAGGGNRPVFMFQRGAVRRQTGTAADGVAAFHGIDLREPGTLRCDVVAGAGIATAWCAIGHGEDQVLEVALAPAPVLAGTVRDGDGRPAAGARVQLTARDEWMTVYVAVAGRDGRFAFPSLRPGRYSYVAHRGGERRPVRAWLDLEGEGRRDLELRVE